MDVEALGVAVSRTNYLSKVGGRNNPWELIAYDNFNDTSKWSFLNGSTGNADTAWTVSGNIITPPSTANDHLAFYNGVNFSDGRVQAIIENMSTSLVGAGVFARSKSNSDVIVAWVFGSGAGAQTVQLWKYNATASNIITANLTTADVQVPATARPFSIEMELLGNIINVYVNGRKCISYSGGAVSNTYMYGQCGLIQWNGTAAQFSNFSVRQRKYNVVSPSVQTVLCIGDSITYGTGTSGAGPSTSWATLFGINLNKSFTMSPVSIVNQGHPGYTSTQLLPLLSGYLTQYNPDLVTIECGVNDLKDSNYTVSTFATVISNLQQMIKLVKGYGAVPIVTTLTPISTTLNLAPDWSSSTWPRVHQLNVRIRNMCAQENIICIDNFNAFSNDMTLIAASDGIHPTDAGAARMASCALNAVQGAFSLY